MTHPRQAVYRKKAGWYALCLTVALSAMGATWFEAKYTQPPLPKIKQLPGFDLTESSGHSFSLEELKGRVWLADFIYTTCPGSCPMLSSRLSSLQGDAFKNDAVRFVSVSVNPEHDTPEVLRQYAAKFHAQPAKWLFLTGEKSKLCNLVNRGFMLESGDSVTVGAELVHSTKLVLVDKSGCIRAYYDGISPDEPRKILRDLSRLLRE